MTFGDTRHLFVSGSMSQTTTDYDIWIGHFDVSLIFGDGFKSGNPSIWTVTTP